MKSPLNYPRNIDQPIPLAYYLVLLLSLCVLYGSYMYGVTHLQSLYENTEYVMWRYNQDRIAAGRDEPLSLLAIGDSTLKAGLIPELLGPSVENLALGGSTPIVGYLTLRDYLAHNPGPEKLVISYTPHHLIRQDSFWERTMRYQYGSDADYRAVIALANELDDPVLEGNRYWKYRWNPATYAAPLVRGLRTQRWSKFGEEYQTLEAAGGHHYFGKREAAHRPNAETRHDAFTPSPVLDHYLRELIRLAVANGIETWWISHPISRISCDKLAEGFAEGFSDYLRELASLGITTDAGFPCWDNNQFGDASHLYTGSPRFTEKLAEFVGLERH